MFPEENTRYMALPRTHFHVRGDPQLAVVALLLFALVVAIFAVQNAQEVPVRFFVYSFSNLPLSVVIIGSVAVGAVFIGLLWLIRHVRLVMKLREANAKIKKSEAQLKEMGEVEKVLRERISVLEANRGGTEETTVTAGAIPETTGAANALGSGAPVLSDSPSVPGARGVTPDQIAGVKGPEAPAAGEFRGSHLGDAANQKANSQGRV